MSSRISLITIILAYCIVHTCRAAAVSWPDGTCPINISEDTSKETLNTFFANGATNYTILTQNVPGRFVIASTGILKSATDLDYESNQKSYSVQIMAFNADPYNKSLTCEIRVTDVNDEEPLFVPESYYVTTVKNVATNTNLLTVSATDKDVTAAFNKVMYSIKDEGNGANFTVDVNTGVIRAKTILAAADPVNLTLNVVATDNNKDSFTAEASVKVCLGCKTSGSSAREISLFASMTLVFSVS